MVLDLREHTLEAGASSDLPEIWDRFPPLQQYLQREYADSPAELISFKGAAAPVCAAPGCRHALTAPLQPPPCERKPCAVRVPAAPCITRLPCLLLTCDDVSVPFLFR